MTTRRTDIFADLDLTDAGQVAAALQAGAEANRTAACRTGSIDVIEPPGTLIATGDIHDNPIHLKRLADAALVSEETRPRHDDTHPFHLVLHEIIHSDRLLNGLDFSFRALTRVAAAKAICPERVHTLLANHELAQMHGSLIVKNGVRMVQAFNDAIDHAFGPGAERVRDAVHAFIRSMPIALRARTPHGDILCSHSLPPPAAMARFDVSILERELTDADLEPRQGSAYFMVWGRGYDHDQLEDLVERWGVNLFILGHEHTNEGVKVVEPNAVVLNSDHERGVYWPIDLSEPVHPRQALTQAVALAGDRT